MKVSELIKLMTDELNSCGLEDAEIKIIPKRELGFFDCFLDIEPNVGICAEPNVLTIEFDAYNYERIMEMLKW